MITVFIITYIVSLIIITCEKKRRLWYADKGKGRLLTDAVHWNWRIGSVKISLNKYNQLSSNYAHNHKQNFFSVILWGGYFEYVHDYNGRFIGSSLVNFPAIIHRSRNVFHNVNNESFESNCWTLQIYYGKKIEQKMIKV